MEYKVLSYDESVQAHKCECVGSSDGRDDVIRFVDLFVNGDFPKTTTADDLVGKTFEADYEHPYIAIAMNVRAKKC